MIYTFGNSHAHLFTGSDPKKYGFGEKSNPYFTSFSLGPVIAYNFLESHHSKLISVLESIDFNKKEDYIMLIVGEVDCRWHLPSQVKIQGRSKESIVEECIDRLFTVYLDLINRGYKIIGWGGHPSTTSEHDENPNCPVFGNCKYRNNISIIWDEYISLKCEIYNIPYISIINDLINEDGLTRMEYFMDYCHLDTKMTEPIYLNKFKKINIL